MELVGFGFGNVFGRSERMDFGKKEGVIGVNIADAGKARLVMEEIFDGTRG